MRHSSPTVLEAAASAARAWQEDVRLAAGRMGLTGRRDPLPALHVDVLLEPVNLAALIGLPGPAVSPEGPAAAAGATHEGPAELRSAPRAMRSDRWPGSPQRRLVPMPSLVPVPFPVPVPSPVSVPSRAPVPSPAPVPSRAAVPPAGRGAGAAKIAAVLQRYEAQAAAAAAASAAAGRLTRRAFGEGSSPRSDRIRTGPGRPAAAVPASEPGPRALVARPGRAGRRSRPDTDERARTALDSMADTVDGRLRSWSQGIDVPPLADSARSVRSAADAARPSGPPVIRPPSAGDSRTAGGARRGAGPASAGRPAPVVAVPVSSQLAKLIDLVAQAADGVAAVESRLTELGVREAPQVEWLEDDELAGRLQGILARQARRRGIDLS